MHIIFKMNHWDEFQMTFYWLVLSLSIALNFPWPVELQAHLSISVFRGQNKFSGDFLVNQINRSALTTIGFWSIRGWAPWEYYIYVGEWYNDCNAICYMCVLGQCFSFLNCCYLWPGDSCHVNNLWEIAPNKNLSSRNKCSLSSVPPITASIHKSITNRIRNKEILMTNFNSENFHR